MMYSEMVFDAGIYLGFFLFGMASMMFLNWVEDKARRK